EYLSSVMSDEYVRRDLIKLYLKAGIPEKAEPIAEGLDKSNVFNLQSLCKVYCAKGDFHKALKYIDKALVEDTCLKKVYRAAFRHDRAVSLHGIASQEAEAVMKEAIDLQPNPKTRKAWREELSTWMQ
ncbi:MAG: hypothetical protein K2K05_02460, partial [Muribaculaceae bacterium]|nr:hypothetical protein [Muribaculaceae bacterium]